MIIISWLGTGELEPKRLSLTTATSCGMTMVNALSVLLSAVGIVFLAELGDKTMISTAVLAMRTKRFLIVLLISILAFVVANMIAILAAWILGYMIERVFISTIAGLLFIAVGIWMLIEREEELKEFRGGIAACFLAITLAEIGDKTQLAVFTTALATGCPLYALMGGIIGYTIANAIGVLVVKILGDKVQWTKIKTLASAIMIGIGLWLLIEVLVEA